MLKSKKNYRNVLKITLLLSCALIIFSLQPLLVYAAPSVSNITGTVSNGQSITIEGLEFGSGPTVVLFDDFESGANGANIPTSGPKIGTYNSVSDGGGGVPTYSTSYAVSGRKSMHVNYAGNGTYGTQQVTASLGASGTNEITFSYWMLLTGEIPGTSGEGANLKQMWLTSAPPGAEVNDYVDVILSNLPVSNELYTFNDTTGSRWESPWIGSNLSFGIWLRRFVHMTFSLSNGASVYDQEISSAGYRTRVNVSNVNTARNSQLWKYLHLPGYGRQDNNAHEYIDDFYVATGPNALARVEIGNQPIYTNCTNLTLLTPTAWSGSSITATVRQGQFANGATGYLYVVDSTGAVSTPTTQNANKIIFGSSPVVSPPAVPTALTVR